MSFKIDTKEKFTVITPDSDLLDANIAAKIWETATMCINSEQGNVIINLSNATTAHADAVNDMASLQQHFYDNNKSFVICNVQPNVLSVFKNEDLTDILNITPTESEAWDIVQMEEIEREMFSDDESSES